MNTRRRYSEKTIALRHPELYARLLKASVDALILERGLME